MSEYLRYGVAGAGVLVAVAMMFSDRIRAAWSKFSAPKIDTPSDDDPVLLQDLITLRRSFLGDDDAVAAIDSILIPRAIARLSKVE